jgi:hypothetical protein
MSSERGYFRAILNDFVAVLVEVVFDVITKLAVHTTPGVRFDKVTVSGETVVVNNVLDTVELSESFFTVTSTVTPDGGIFELMVTFASWFAPKAAYIPEPGSMSIEKMIFSSATGVGVVPPPLLDLPQESRPQTRHIISNCRFALWILFIFIL